MTFSPLPFPSNPFDLVGENFVEEDMSHGGDGRRQEVWTIVIGRHGSRGLVVG